MEFIADTWDLAGFSGGPPSLSSLSLQFITQGAIPGPLAAIACLG